MRLLSSLLLTAGNSWASLRKGSPAESPSQLFLKQWFPNFSVYKLGRTQLTVSRSQRWWGRGCYGVFPCPACLFPRCRFSHMPLHPLSPASLPAPFPITVILPTIGGEVLAPHLWLLPCSVALSTLFCFSHPLCPLSVGSTVSQLHRSPGSLKAGLYVVKIQMNSLVV